MTDESRKDYHKIYMGVDFASAERQIVDLIIADHETRAEMDALADCADEPKLKPRWFTSQIPMQAIPSDRVKEVTFMGRIKGSEYALMTIDDVVEPGDG